MPPSLATGLVPSGGVLLEGGLDGSGAPEGPIDGPGSVVGGGGPIEPSELDVAGALVGALDGPALVGVLVGPALAGSVLDGLVFDGAPLEELPSGGRVESPSPGDSDVQLAPQHRPATENSNTDGSDDFILEFQGTGATLHEFDLQR